MADLSVTKTVSDATPNVGDQITFTVTLSNQGADTATGVQVTDLLPAGVSFVSANPSQGTYSNVSGVWTVGTVSPGVPQTLSITATVVSPAAQTNTGTISDADQFDPNTGNNTASATETPQQADLSVSKTVSDATPNVGDQITFTVTLSNQGADTATGVQVTDLLPAGLTFVSATPSQGSYDNVSGMWTVGTVSPGVPQTLSITATVVSPAAQTNTGTISDADQFDPNTGNNTASATETPQQAADLLLIKSVSDATPNVGDQIVYTITVFDAGPDAATGVQVTDLLPAGLTFVSATPSQGSYDNVSGVWTVGTVSPGVPQTLSITATVVSPAAQTNTGTISDADQFDPNTGNNTASATETPQQADLSVSKTVSDATPNVGDQITFTVTLSNQGADTATGVQVTDLLPAGLTFVSATPSQGSYDNISGVWTVGTVSPGIPQTLSIAATVVSPAAQTNTGTISDADQFDPNTGNNTASATETPQQADLSLVKFVNGQDADSPTGPHVAAGSTVTFTYVVTDTGNVPVSGVVVRDDNGTPANPADDFNPTFSGGDTNTNGLLDTTETWTYTATATALAGQQTNVGTVTGQDVNTLTTVTDDNPANYFGDAPAVPPPTSDFDGDNKSDIPWQSNNGTAAIWLMDGTNSTFVGAVGPFNPGPTWHIKATGDFNGDSKADIIWQHDNGLTAMWQMDGTNATFVGAVGPFNPEAPWDIKATGDFDGDGKSDIIWQHDNGLTAMWQMDGTNATFVGAVGPFNPGATWEIKGTGDFNGDGKSDIIWQGQDGTPAIWLMDGTNATFVGAIGPFNPGPSWEIKGTGDFNGDGKSDIIWQGQDGTPAIWLMDGTNATFVGAIGPFNPGPSWEIKGTGDFNGDGKDDIIWQGQDGTPAIWLMDGTDVVSIGAAGSFNPGSDWHVII